MEEERMEENGRECKGRGREWKENTLFPPSLAYWPTTTSPISRLPVFVMGLLAGLQDKVLEGVLGHWMKDLENKILMGLQDGVMVG